MKNYDEKCCKHCPLDCLFRDDHTGPCLNSSCDGESA